MGGGDDELAGRLIAIKELPGAVQGEHVRSICAGLIELRTALTPPPR